MKESLCKKHNYFKFRIYVYVYKGPKRAFSRLRISQKQRQMSSLLVGGRYCRNRDIAQGDMKKIMGVLSKTFLQFILAAKSLVQHLSIRPDPAATTLAFSSVRFLFYLNCFIEKKKN